MGGLARDLVLQVERTVHVLGFLLIDVHAILLVDLGVPLHVERARKEGVGGATLDDRDGRGNIFFLAHKLILLLVVWMLDVFTSLPSSCR